MSNEVLLSWWIRPDRFLAATLVCILCITLVVFIFTPVFVHDTVANYDSRIHEAHQNSAWYDIEIASHSSDELVAVLDRTRDRPLLQLTLPRNGGAVPYVSLERDNDSNAYGIVVQFPSTADSDATTVSWVHDDEGLLFESESSVSNGWQPNPSRHIVRSIPYDSFGGDLVTGPTIEIDPARYDGTPSEQFSAAATDTAKAYYQDEERWKRLTSHFSHLRERANLSVDAATRDELVTLAATSKVLYDIEAFNQVPFELLNHVRAFGTRKSLFWTNSESSIPITVNYKKDKLYRVTRTYIGLSVRTEAYNQLQRKLLSDVRSSASERASVLAAYWDVPDITTQDHLVKHFYLYPVLLAAIEESVTSNSPLVHRIYSECEGTERFSDPASIRTVFENIRNNQSWGYHSSYSFSYTLLDALLLSQLFDRLDDEAGGRFPKAAQYRDNLRTALSKYSVELAEFITFNPKAYRFNTGSYDRSVGGLYLYVLWQLWAEGEDLWLDDAGKESRERISKAVLLLCDDYTYPAFLQRHRLPYADEPIDKGSLSLAPIAIMAFVAKKHVTGKLLTQNDIDYLDEVISEDFLRSLSALSGYKRYYATTYLARTIEVMTRMTRGRSLWLQDSYSETRALIYRLADANNTALAAKAASFPLSVPPANNVAGASADWELNYYMICMRTLQAVHESQVER